MRPQVTHDVDLFAGRLSIWLCPWCSWSLTADYYPPDYAGIEAAIADHLDEDHSPWTIEQLRLAVLRWNDEHGGR